MTPRPLVVALAILAGCSSEPPREEVAPPAEKPTPATPRPPAPAPAPVPATPTAAPRPGPAPAPASTSTSASASVGGGAPSYAPDFWYERFHEHMSVEMRRAYLATPREERFARFGDVLLAIERREAQAVEARARTQTQPPEKP